MGPKGDKGDQGALGVAVVGASDHVVRGEQHLVGARLSKSAKGDVRLRLEPLDAPTLAVVLRRGPLREEPRRLGFERFPQLVELADLAPGEKRVHPPEASSVTGLKLRGRTESPSTSRSRHR